MAGIDTEGLAKFLEGELETEADLVVKGETDIVDTSRFSLDRFDAQGVRTRESL